jgi:hypothetical protein
LPFWLPVASVEARQRVLKKGMRFNKLGEWPPPARERGTANWYDFPRELAPKSTGAGARPRE